VSPRRFMVAAFLATYFSIAAALCQPLSGAAEPYSAVEVFDQPWRIVSFLESAKAVGYHQFDITFASPSTPEDYPTVWIGTSNGLLEYDGFDWTQHQAGQSPLPSNMVRSVLVARDGRLWVGSDKGAGVYDGSSYQTLGSESGLAGPNVRRIVEDPDGTLWFCSDAWPNAAASGVITSYSNGVWHAYGIEEGLPSAYVANYFRDSSGRQFAATRSGVAQFDGERWNLSLSVDPNSQNLTSSSFAESPTLGVLLSDGQNIYRFENNEWHKLPHTRLHRYGLLTTRAGETLAAAQIRGRLLAIANLRPDGWKDLSAPFDTAIEAVEQLKESPDGSIWAVGGSVLIQWRRQNSNWTEFKGVPPPLFTDGTGRVWFRPDPVPGKPTSPLIRFADSVWEQLPTTPTHLKLDSKGHVWAWSATNLVQWIGNTETRFTPADLELDRITNGQTDRSGNFWATGRDDQNNIKLAHHDGTKWSTRPILTPELDILRTFTAQNGIWLLTSNGQSTTRTAWHFTDTDSRQIDIPQELDSSFPPNLDSSENDEVLSLFGDTGLHVLRRGSDWKAFDTLPGRHVSAVVHRQGETWVASSGRTGGQSGLIRIDQGRMTLFPLESEGSLRQEPNGTLLFSLPHGAGVSPPPPESNPFELELPNGRSPRGLTIDGAGRFWFGTSDSVLRFTPSPVASDTRLELVNTNVTAGIPMGFKAYVVERGSPGKKYLAHRFSWRIDGGSWTPFSAETEWSPPMAFLGVGSHQIEARSQSADLKIDTTPASLRIWVEPVPIQSRPWFLPVMTATCVVLVILAGAALHARSLLLRYSQTLEDSVNARTAELNLDIQQRIETEQALRETTAKYQTLIDNSHDGIFIAGNGNILFANPATLRMGGWTSEMILNKPFVNIIAPEYRDLITKRYHARLRREQVESTYEGAILCSDGSVKPVEISAALLNQEALQTIVQMRDISARFQHETELRQHEERLVRTQEIAQLGSWEHNHLDDTVICSNEVFRLFGVPPKQAPRTYEELLDAVHPNDRQSFHFAYRRSIEDPNTGFDHESRVIRKSDGEIRIVRSKCEHIRDAADNVIRTYGMAHDITEIKFFASALVASQTILTAIRKAQSRYIDDARPGHSFDILLSSLLAVTESEYGFIGEVRHHQGGQPFLKMLAITNIAWDEPTRQLYESQSAQGMEFYNLETLFGAVLKTEALVLTDDPSSDPRSSGLPPGHPPMRTFAGIPFFHNGRMTGVIALANREAGYTETLCAEFDPLLETCAQLVEAWRIKRLHLETEEQLRRSEERFRELAENISEVFWVTDASRSAVLYVSPAFEDIWGCTRDSLYETPELWLNSVHSDDRAKIEAHQTKGQVSREYDVHYRIHRPDGTERWIRDRAFPVRDANRRVIRVVGVATDVTTEHRNEEERLLMERQIQHSQKLESLGVLAGGIAHDFNNLLTSILGNASLARRALPPASKALGMVDEITRGAQRAAGLTRQMLAYAGKERMEISPFQLSALVNEMTGLLRVSISKKVHLTCNLAPDLPAVFGDSSQIGQVLMNLVINASEAIGESSGTITIKTGLQQITEESAQIMNGESQLKSGPYVFLHVSDTGSGMDAETQEKMFDPFFTTKFTGRGLGMSVVQGIIRSHGGAIQLASKVGAGSTFRIFLPAAGRIPEPVPEKTEPQEEWRGEGCILVVEDEEAVRELTCAMVEVMGFSTIRATDGRQGVTLFREHSNDIRLVLSDLTMPHLDGREFVRQVAAIRSSVPTVLMSGFNENSNSPEAGFFIQKPFSFEGLRSVIQKALGNKAS
jgi:PAS domain S-box-containing protein